VRRCLRPSRLGLILSADPAAAASKNCAAGQTSSGSATQTPSPTTGQASKSALVPTPESKSLRWEFDGDRDETYWDVVIQANPPAGAKVFAAGAFTVGGSALVPPMSTMIENLRVRLNIP
jgi:hypothetical protein